MMINNLVQSKRGRFGLFGAAILAVVVVLMIEQQRHYAHARLNAVQDYQEALHGDVFHVLTFVRAAEGQDFFAPLRSLVDAAEGSEGEMIYAGQVIHTGIRSQQISETFGATLDWHAIVLQQFAGRDAYEAYSRRPAVVAALEAFEVTYTHGFERSAGFNLLLHQMFLAIRSWRTLTFAPDVLPFEPGSVERPAEISTALLEHANRLGRDAILIVNLARDGSAEEQAANADYSLAMLGLMADLRYGPMHMGSTVSLEHGHRFDQAMLVFYPGSRYFHDLSNSTWFQSIIGDKQLADTQACITVPVTNLLLN